MHNSKCLVEVEFIYNEIDKQGDFKAVYYDSKQLKSKLRFVINRKRKLVELSNEQQEAIDKMVKHFISGMSGYNYGGDNDIDHTLLVTCYDGSQQVSYYYWKNNENPPKGSERLLEFLGNVFRDFNVTYK